MTHRKTESFYPDWLAGVGGQLLQPLTMSCRFRSAILSLAQWQRTPPDSLRIRLQEAQLCNEKLLHASLLQPDTIKHLAEAGKLEGCVCNSPPAAKLGVCLPIYRHSSLAQEPSAAQRCEEHLRLQLALSQNLPHLRVWSR